jgi:hypothetical protein
MHDFSGYTACAGSGRLPIAKFLKIWRSLFEPRIEFDKLPLLHGALAKTNEPSLMNQACCAWLFTLMIVEAWPFLWK